MAVTAGRSDDRAPGRGGVPDLHTVGTGVIFKQVVDVGKDVAFGLGSAGLRQAAEGRILHGVASQVGHVTGAGIVPAGVHPMRIYEMGVLQPDPGHQVIHPANVAVDRAVSERHGDLLGGVIATPQHHSVEKGFEVELLPGLEAHDLRAVAGSHRTTVNGDGDDAADIGLALERY